MIQEPYPFWPAPGTVTEVDVKSPLDGSAADGLRRHYRLRQRSICARIRDWWRGFADVDFESYDAKVKRLRRGTAAEFTEAEESAALKRRLIWRRK